MAQRPTQTLVSSRPRLPFYRWAAEAQKILRITEPLDSKAGLCGRVSAWGPSAPRRASSLRRALWRASPPSLCSASGRPGASGLASVPLCRGRPHRTLRGLLFAFLPVILSRPGKRWAWSQVCRWGGHLTVHGPLSKVLTVAGALGWASCSTGDQLSRSVREQGFPGKQDF